MGQAALNLPDPLDQQHAADAGGMDDLLSQLAGDEIDRLLAQTDHQTQSPPPPRLSKNSPLAKLNQLADAEIDPNQSLIPGVPPAPAEAATSAFAGEDDPDKTTEAELRALLSELDEEPPPGGADAADAAPFASAEASTAYSGLLPREAAEQVLAEEAASHPGGTAARGSVSHVPEPRPDDASAAERAALEETAPSRESAEAGSAIADDEAAEPLPLLLRPLDWLSAPMEASPQWVRDLIGKAAILTLLNAVAVLIYVMVFRRG